jgi:murein DD-endopeptidase MepM/ murein hydrolase activator NlpD
MPTERHTIIFVPHTRARLRQWHVSSLHLKIAIATVLFATVSSIAIFWAYVTTDLDQAGLKKLEAENQDLRQANQYFEESIQKLEQQLADYEDRTRKLAIVAGLESLSDGAEAGIGGESDAAAPAAGTLDLIRLEDRAGTLAGRLDEVAARLDERFRFISSTPAIIPARGIITSGFGYRRDPLHGNRAFHQGIDIAAAPAQPVKATADGIVTHAGREGGLGTAVFISHGYGLSSRYGHLSKAAVKAGQRVKRGDVIGHVGNSGRSTGYHLHYEVRVDGEPVNPLAYILDTPLGR